jgi:hypothetical protein
MKNKKVVANIVNPSEIFYTFTPTYSIYTTGNLLLFRTNIASGCLSDTQIYFSLTDWLAKDSNRMKETIIYLMLLI